jgi:hypothetical protein
MLSLYQSKNLGVKYELIDTFKTLDQVLSYLSANIGSLNKNRWFVENKQRQIILACPVFESTLKLSPTVGISDDKHLKRYLRQQRRLKKHEPIPIIS